MPVPGPLDDRRRIVEAELMQAAGGASLCAISKSAGSVPAAKYFEGRLAVVMELERAVRAGEPLASALERVGGAWRQGLVDVTEREMGPDWIAYRSGGVDECAELDR